MKRRRRFSLFLRKLFRTTMPLKGKIRFELRDVEKRPEAEFARPDRSGGG